MICVEGLQQIANVLTVFGVILKWFPLAVTYVLNAPVQSLMWLGIRATYAYVILGPIRVTVLEESVLIVDG